MTPPTDKTNDRLAALAAEFEPVFDAIFKIANTPADRYENDSAWAYAMLHAAQRIYANAQRIRATLAADQPKAGEAVAVHFLARIFAAQRLREDGSYAGWKLSGPGSLNEVVEEARAWLNMPLTATTPPAAKDGAVDDLCRDDWISAAEIESRLDTLAEEYEWCGDEGDYTPNDRERTLLVDFAHGIMADEVFVAMMKAHHDPNARGRPLALAASAQQAAPDWRIGMFDRWNARAQELGFAGIAEAVEASAQQAVVSPQMVRRAFHLCPIELGFGPKQWKWMAEHITSALRAPQTEGQGG